MADSDAFGGAGGSIAVDPADGRQTTLSRDGMFVEPSAAAFGPGGGIIVSDSDAATAG